MNDHTRNDTDSRAPGLGTTGWHGLEGYEHLTVLGHGGTATVYSATRTSDGSPMAIKVFDPSESNSFDRQLAAAERLGDLTGALGVEEHGTLGDGRPFIVSPFAPGGSLSEQIQRFGPMSPVRVAALGALLAISLGEAHSAGVLHRDIKPSNVLLGADGLPLLADFGAAGLIDPKTASDTLAITVMYAAPEVLEGGRATERSDIYSLGLTLLALAVGGPPFSPGADSGLATLLRTICIDGPPDPSTLDLPVGLAAVLRQATSLDPADRYESGSQFGEALTAVCADLDTAPTDSAPPPRLASSGDGTRRRLAVAGVAVLAVVLVAGAAWFTRSDDRTTEAGTGTTLPASLGEPATPANGIMGPLYQQDEITYVGLLAEPCEDGDTLAELSIHAGPADTAEGVDTPWEAVSGEGAGTFMAWMPCDAGIPEARFKLGATGRWFVFTAEFPRDQYERMVAAMRDNETSPSPDYTVDEDVLATLRSPDVYKGWAVIDRPA